MRLDFTEQQKEAMKRHRQSYIDQINNFDIIETLELKKAKVSGYICPCCSSGSGKNATGAQVTKDHRRITCFANPQCKLNGSGQGQDVFGALKAVNDGKSSDEVIKMCFPTYDIKDALRSSGTGGKKATEQPTHTQGENILPIIENAPETTPEALDAKPDFTEYYKECRKHITDPAAREYLSLRGISEETAARYWLGYDPATGFLIIPAASSFYVARNTDRQSNFRYKNPTGAAIELFNKKALYNDSARPIFITEGAMDALSIIEAGREAVSLNSTANVRKLLKELESKRTGNTLILCLDNDDAGRKAAAELTEGLRELNITFIRANISGQYKDPNAALTADRDTFIDAIAEAERGTIRPDNTADYISQFMAADIDNLRKQSNRKTGFPNLDAEAGGIYAGLYAVGGISSVGKTTFISQIADQMAAQGQHVLFFSMEQSRFEMVSKSISRQTAKDDPEKAVSSLQIRTGAKGDNISRAIAQYTGSVGDRISIIEGNFNCTVSFISNYTRQYIGQNGGIKPVIIVDYLQVLQAEKDPETGRKSTDTKQIVDYNVTQLKRLSRSLEIPVFVISSVNRSNYLTPIDFEAFKESGGIEYTADVVWGLQLAVINDPIFDKDGSIKKKREAIAQAKEAMPRDIELVCLKNRYGKSRYKAQFVYYPQFDYFRPAT